MKRGHLVGQSSIKIVRLVYNDSAAAQKHSGGDLVTMLMCAGQ